MAEGIEVLGPFADRFDEVLTPEALAFVADLHSKFNPARRSLLSARAERQLRLDAGEMPDFLEVTADVRAGDWTVAPPPPDLIDRRTEITGPTDRKMMINALNSGASAFMADLEDANSPTWHNMVEGQVNLMDTVRRTIRHESPDGQEYALNETTATLLVRPRGWHLEERHVLINGEPVAAALFDFGLYLYHNATELLARGTGPYFYLPKLESHLEARLWNDVFLRAQEAIGVPAGTIRATVLIETILAAFEMNEILYELREHSAGLNAGRWDYIFSCIKKFRNHAAFTLPDRSQVTMTVPFMRAYTELMIATCHRRKAHAIGGMAAFIPSRRDEEVNRIAFANVREDKERESEDGNDGTWVAHPDLVPLAKAVFAERLGDRAHQIELLRDDVSVAATDLVDFSLRGAAVTDAGLRLNVDVAIQYLASWLRGNGAAAIHHMMEDAATAEISRSQVWQWVRHEVTTAEGNKVTPQFVHRVADEVTGRIRAEFGDDMLVSGRFLEARALFERVALTDEFSEFLTLPAYDILTTDS